MIADTDPSKSYQNWWVGWVHSPRSFSGKNRGLIEIPVPRIVILVTEPASWGCAALPSPQAESGSWVQTIKRYKRLGTTLVALQAPFVSKNWPRCQGFVLNMTYRWGIWDACGFTGLVASGQIMSIASSWVHLWFAYAKHVGSCVKI